MRLVACLTASAVALSGAAIAVVQYTSSSSSANADESTISQSLTRDGWDKNEPALSPAAVKGSGFGQIFSTKVNGQVFGQPLVVGKSVLVATENDWVYSINRNTGTVNWSRQLGSPYAAAAENCTETPTVKPYVGATSTPVYDPGTGTLYVSAMVSGPPGDDAHLSTATPQYVLSALNATTGAVNWQQTIAGHASNDPSLAFDATNELQRTGLLLLNGSVYLGFGSLCEDGRDYWGFIAGVNTTTKAQTLWSAAGLDGASAQTVGGGIWQGGGGLASDGTHIYFSTGNGAVPAAGPRDSAPASLGQSVVRLDVQGDGSLKAGDFFAPGNADQLNPTDHDLGSAGVSLLPFGTSAHAHLAVTAAKDARVFLLDTASLGGRSASEAGSSAVFTGTDDLVGNPPGTVDHGLWGHMAAMAGVGPSGETLDYLYYQGTGWGSQAPLQVLKFDGSDKDHPVLTNAGATTQQYGFSSGSPVITSNGTAASSALVWLIHATNASGVGGSLDAYAAVPDSNKVLQQVWTAPIGSATEFSVPATDAGQIFVGTRNDGTSATCPTNFEAADYTSTDSACVGAVWGFGVKSAQLAASATTVNLGHVALGQTSSATVTLSNTGDTPVTITKFTAPDVPFGTPRPLAPSQVVPAGGAVSLPVTFSPQARGTITGKYTITATDGFSAARTLTISVGGVGSSATAGVVVPTPGGGWKLNGSAAMSGTALRLNSGANQTGSAVFYQPVPSNGLKATFTAQLSGGNGGDGLTFALINPSDSTSALGQGGAMLGFGGMHGVAIVLGTRKDLGFPSANFVGIATGTAGTGSSAHLALRAYSTQVPSLRTGTHVIGVTVAGTTVTVSVNGTAYVSANVALPATVLPAFTAANSNPSDVHAVSGVAVTSTLGAVPPPGGGWSFNNAAAMSGSDTLLTPAVASKSGAVVYPRTVSTTAFKAIFDAQLGGGSGGDGMTLALLSPTTKVTAWGSSGQGLGFAGLSGVAVVLGTHQLPGAPSANFVGISNGATNGALNFLATAALPGSLRSGTHVVTVFLRSGTLTVSIDGAVVLSHSVSVPASAHVAFTGGTGSLTDAHIVRDGALSANAWGQ